MVSRLDARLFLKKSGVVESVGGRDKGAVRRLSVGGGPLGGVRRRGRAYKPPHAAFFLIRGGVSLRSSTGS